MDIYETISKYEKTKMEAMREAKNRELNQMNIDPDCYVAREIEYQTAILHEILEKQKFLERKVDMISKNLSQVNFEKRLSLNEMRQKSGLEPVPGGDTILVRM